MSDTKTSERSQGQSAKAERDKPWLFRTYAGHSTAAKSNELYKKNLAQGADRPLDRLRSADPDGLRLRSRAGARRGRQGRRPGFAPRRHAHAARRHSARPDEHVDDDQRDGRVAAVALYRRRRSDGRLARQAHRHHSERHHQGIPVARHLRVPARAVAPADQGHDRLLDQERAEVESDERLLLPSAGSRRDAGAGTRLRARDGDRRARHREGLGRGSAGRVRQRRRPRLVLRQRRHALRHRDVQDARIRRALGRDHARALRRDGREAPACSATACRSTRSASPSRRPRTTSIAS